MLRIGPVLSFRGIVAQQWGVTAMIGIARNQAPPSLELEGQPCAAPVLLYQDANDAYWRYDLSCDLQASERKLTYAIVGADMRWSFTVICEV